MKNKIKRILLIFITFIVLFVSQVHAILGTLLVTGLIFDIGGLYALHLRNETNEMQVKPEANQYEIDALGKIMQLHDKFLEDNNNNKIMQDYIGEIKAEDVDNAKKMLDTVLLTLDNSGYKTNDLIQQAKTSDIKKVMDKIILSKKFLNGLEGCIKKTGKNLGGYTSGTKYKGDYILTDGVDINDDFKTKFNYTIPQIVLYNELYTRYNIAINLNSKEAEIIKNIWKMKLDNNNSGFNDNGMYVDKYDPVHVKMKYTPNQIKAYIGLYGWDNNAIGFIKYNDTVEQENWMKELVQTEWEYRLQTGGNTSNFCKRYETNNSWLTSGNYSDRAWQILDSNNKAAHAEAYNDERKDGQYKNDDTFWKEWNEAKKANLLAIQRLSIHSVSDEELYKIEYTMQETGLRNLAESNYETNDSAHSSEIYILPTRDSDTISKTDIDSVVTSADEFLATKENKDVQTIEIKDLSNTIYNILFIAGIIIAVIIGAIIGIKYIAGSIEEKANLKQVLVPYLVGCAVVFGAFGIWKLAVTIFTDM